jgi:hypothetical protein
MIACAVQTGRLADETHYCLCRMSGQLSDSAPIQGINALAKGICI